MPSNFNEPRAYEQYLLTLALLLISALLVYSEVAKKLDLLFYDTAIHISPAEVDDDVVIISIDEKSLNALGQWPWRRAVHAQLIDKLAEYNTALVAFDVIFSERSTNHPADDAYLARAVNNNGNVLLPIHIHPLSYGNTLSEILPIPELVEAAKALGHVHVELDEDGLARGLFLHSGIGSARWPSLSMAMALQINPMIKHLQQAEDTQHAPYFSVNTDYRLIPFAGPGGTYSSYSYIDVLTDDIDADAFRDKVVIVGASAAGLGDTLPTPMSRLSVPMSGVELHANAYSAIMSQTAIRPVHEIWSYLLTFAFILIPILLFPRLQPTHVMPCTLLLVAMVLAFSYSLMRYDFTWFPPVNSILGILIAYPLWSWQRMRHLNSFLNNELARLSSEPDLGFRKLEQHSPESVFLSLLALLKPVYYAFSKNGHGIHVFESERLDTMDLPEANRWYHNKTSSWIRITLNEDTFEIGVGWPEGEKPMTAAPYLNKLDLSYQDLPKTKRSYEQVTNRIAQVRTAISAMQDMRIFISKGFEEMPGSVIVADPLGKIVFCNSHAQEWFDKTEDELLNSSIYDYFQDLEIPESEKICRKISSVLLSGEQSNFEAAIQERDALVHCLPFLVDQNSDVGLMMTLSDISEIRQRQREKNELIDFLSHDLRSPLVSQLAMLDGIRTGRIQWAPELVEEVASHAQRSLNLSEQFLQITRAEQSPESAFYEFDLLSTIENSLDAQAAFAKSKQIQLKLKTDEEVWVNGNAELMERAFINLISNAIKYSDPDTRVTVSLRCIDKTALVMIQDQGHGIAREELPFIFNRFRRQKETELKGEKGAGLGLNFVQVVMEKHHGQIGVDSVLGQGTTFTINLPAVAEPGD